MDTFAFDIAIGQFLNFTEIAGAYVHHYGDDVTVFNLTTDHSARLHEATGTVTVAFVNGRAMAVFRMSFADVISNWRAAA